MVLNEKSLVLPLKQPLQVMVDKINTSDWCLIPEALGMQYEAVNSIAQEIELSQEYLGNNTIKRLNP